MVEIVHVSPHVRNDFSSERAKAVYVPSSRPVYDSMYLPTNGMFAIEGDPAKVRSFKLEPLVQVFGEISPNLAESIRVENTQRIQAAHEKFLRYYDGSVMLGVYLTEGTDTSLKVVVAVHDAFSNENGNVTLDKLTGRLAALRGILTKETQLPVPDAPAAGIIRYVSISKDYNAVQKHWERVLAGEIPFTQPI